jgi:hypothetical protein
VAFLPPFFTSQYKIHFKGKFMTYFPSEEIEPYDAIPLLWQHAHFVERLLEMADVLSPIDGRNVRSITKALELAQCYFIPDVIETFCSVGLGYRLIPVGRTDSITKETRKTIDQALTPTEIANIDPPNDRAVILKMLAIWADLIRSSSDLKGFRGGEWIGGRMARDAAGEPCLLWPYLYTPLGEANDYGAFDDVGAAA